MQTSRNDISKWCKKAYGHIWPYWYIEKINQWPASREIPKRSIIGVAKLDTQRNLDRIGREIKRFEFSEETDLRWYWNRWWWVSNHGRIMSFKSNNEIKYFKTQIKQIILRKSVDFKIRNDSVAWKQQNQSATWFGIEVKFDWLFHRSN